VLLLTLGMPSYKVILRQAQDTSTLQVIQKNTCTERGLGVAKDESKCDFCFYW